MELLIGVVVKKLIEMASSVVKGSILKQVAIQKLLHQCNIKNLENTFESIYINSLVEYGMDKSSEDLIKLFANSDVRSALHSELYHNDVNAFKRVAIHLFHVGQLYELKNDFSETTIQNEVNSFMEYFNFFSRETQSPFDLKRYNEQREYNRYMLDKEFKGSFDYQIKLYLNRIFSDKKYSKYVHLDGTELFFKRYNESASILIRNEELQQYSGWLNYDMRSISKGENLIDQFQKWLESDDNVLFLVGEYGTGKTTSLKYFQNLLIKQRDVLIYSNEEEKQIPILLSLHQFEKKIESFIISQLNYYGVTNINFESFLQRLESGQLILILDGFDEISTSVDTGQKRKNFSSFKNLLKYKKEKIIVSVRKEFFTSQIEFFNTFNLFTLRNYRIVEILPFNEEQIMKFIELSVPNKNEYWQKIKNLLQIEDLARRPVLLELIIQYWPDIVKNSKENLSSVDLFTYCINSELARKNDDIAFEIPSTKRLEILIELCTYMFENNTLSFDVNVVKPRIRNLVSDKMDDWEFERFLNEFLAFTFLINDKDNHYRISHKAFRDFFVAKSFFHEIERYPGFFHEYSQATIYLKGFGKIGSTIEVDNFILEMGVNKDLLQKGIAVYNYLGTRANPGAKSSYPYLVSNCINLLLRLCNIDYQKNINFRQPEINLSSSNLIDISAFANLESNVISVDLSNNNIQSISVFKFLHNLSIKNLYLSNNQIANISYLSNFSKLENLDLSVNQISDFDSLSGLIKLKTLNVSSNSLYSLDFLSRISKVDMSTIVNSNDDPKKVIGDLNTLLSQIKILNVSNNKISDLSALIYLKNLQELDVSSNRVKHLQPILQLDDLKKIFIVNNDISSKDLNQFKDKLPKLLFDI